MELFQILGYISAVGIGVSLGLIGGGGSILAVPVLAYLFSIDEKTATAYSLFVVGFSALIGGVKQHLKGYVDWRTVVVFGLPALLGVTLVRYFVVPSLPEVLFTAWGVEVTRRMGMFGLFAVLMIPAGLSMLKGRQYVAKQEEVRYNYSLILVEGIIVGAITGFIGAGGGFLIIPALVLLANIEIKRAIGTSLIIIAIKSLIGFFLGDALTLQINWTFLFVFTALSLVGIFLGSFFANFINGQRLKKGFGIFIFIMAAFIFFMEFLVA